MVTSARVSGFRLGVAPASLLSHRPSILQLHLSPQIDPRRQNSLQREHVWF